MQADTKHELNLITLGVNALHRNMARGNSAGVECIFRLSQDGAHWCIPYLEKRVIVSESLPAFKALLMKKYHEINELLCDKLQQDCEDMGVGCFMIVFKFEGGI